MGNGSLPNASTGFEEEKVAKTMTSLKKQSTNFEPGLETRDSMGPNFLSKAITVDDS